MTEALALHGYAETRSLEDADLVVLNTCHIREKAAEKVYSDLGRIREWMVELQAYWARQAPGRPTPLDPTQFAKFRRRLLHPALDLAESVAADASLADQALVRLSEEQVRVMHGVLGNPRLQVRGGAGTGKTVLALEAAQTLAARGSHVLVLCYTRFLGQHLRGRTERWSFDTGQAEAWTFHELCERAYALEGRPFDPPAEPAAAQHFWDKVAPEMLLGACAAGRIGPWDAIIVDEGQDFVADWWFVIEEALLVRDRGGPALAVGGL
jgi:hypothetical protein